MANSDAWEVERNAKPYRTLVDRQIEKGEDKKKVSGSREGSSKFSDNDIGKGQTQSKLSGFFKKKRRFKKKLTVLNGGKRVRLDSIESPKKASVKKKMILKRKI